MLRTFPTEGNAWPQKTMSVIMRQSMDNCLRRLSLRPQADVLSLKDDAQAQALYLASYDAIAHPASSVLHTVQGMQDAFVSTLPSEAYLLTALENSLLTRLMHAGGHIHLHPTEEVMVAESLCMRNMAFIEFRAEDDISLMMSDRMLETVYRLAYSNEQISFRERLQGFEEKAQLLLYREGMIRETDAMHALSLLVPPSLRFRENMLRRYLHAAFSYLYAPDGTCMLIHSGASETDTMLRHRDALYSAAPDAPFFPPYLAAEDEVAWMMQGQIQQYMRPEIPSEAFTWDMLLMARQGAPREAFLEVMRSSLIMEPLPRMQEMMDLLRSTVIPWAVCSRKQVN
ncbi:MAG: hypothetical protein IJ246_07895 [Clostridia bacterium]|nr:hypothetical protein [Clostridia bacterium]